MAGGTGPPLLIHPISQKKGQPQHRQHDSQRKPITTRHHPRDATQEQQNAKRLEPELPIPIISSVQTPKMFSITLLQIFSPAPFHVGMLEVKQTPFLLPNLAF